MERTLDERSDGEHDLDARAQVLEFGSPPNVSVSLFCIVILELIELFSVNRGLMVRDGLAIPVLEALIVYSAASGWVGGVYWMLIQMVCVFFYGLISSPNFIHFRLFFFSPFLTFHRR